MGGWIFQSDFFSRTRKFALPCFFFQHELALDEQTGRAAAGVVDFHTRLRVNNARHEQAHILGRVELAGAGDAARDELTDEVFITAADDIRLDVVEIEALVADAPDEVAQPVVGQIAHAVGGRIEVHPVNDSLQQRVFVGDGAQVSGELLSDLFSTSFRSCLPLLLAFAVTLP